MDPFEESELTKQLGPLWVVSSRFGLEQGKKLRPVDSMTEPFVNAAFRAREKLNLHGVDQLAALTRAILGCVSSDRRIEIRLSCGEILRGWLAQELSLEDAGTLLGRTLDLEAEYRQLLVAEASSWASVVCVFCPETNKPALFCSEALPFGGSAGVYGFNRHARCLWYIGVVLLNLSWTNFYDDYPTLALASGGEDCVKVQEAFLELVGWRVSQSPSKRKPMCPSFQVLGVEFQLEQSVSGVFLISNRADRVDAIAAQVSSIIARGSLSAAEASSLMG